MFSTQKYIIINNYEHYNALYWNSRKDQQWHVQYLTAQLTEIMTLLRIIWDLSLGLGGRLIQPFSNINYEWAEAFGTLRNFYFFFNFKLVTLCLSCFTMLCQLKPYCPQPSGSAIVISSRGIVHSVQCDFTLNT